ncbi:MAG: c-type cytochrome [Verrucomicrobiota bacterium]
MAGMRWWGWAIGVWSVLATGLSAHPVHAPLQIEFPLIQGFETFYIENDDKEYLADGGEILLGELNCVGCHAPPEGWEDRISGNVGPSLAGVGSRMTTEDIHTMIQYPRFVKTGTRMPALFAAEDRDPAAIEALTHYLASLKEEPREEGDELPEGDEERGATLYHEVGCVACHMPDAQYRPEFWGEDVEAELPAIPSVPVTLAGVYSEDYLTRFLMDPLAHRPGGRMPDFNLSAQEAADIAKYLRTGPTPTPPFEPSDLAEDAELIAAGKGMFESKGCVACHAVGEDGGMAVAGERPAKPLMELNVKAAKSCLSTRAQPGGIPFYRLDLIQRKALTLALERMQGGEVEGQLEAWEAADRLMTRMGCYACHSRDGKGGLELSRAGYFTSSDATAMSLGDQGRLPPPLTHVGRKLTGDWLEKILFGEGGEVRPFLSARMPRYREEDVGRLVELFEEADVREPAVEMDTSGSERHQRSHFGRDLMGINGLGCVTCHGLKGEKALGAPSIDLTRTVERLRPGYFKEVLLDPQGMTPGTLMPPLFMNRAKADQEVEQIWTYLKELDQSRLPDGLLKDGAFELNPAEAGVPILLRTFLEGAGFQAVAVGYPEGLNVAFDALEGRWALAWKGRFLDAMSNWEERHATPAVPLGEEVISLSAGVPFAMLLEADEAWPEEAGEQAGYVFRGYRIEDDGVPVFLYDYAGMKIEDRLAPDEGGGRLERRVTIEGSGDVYFEGLQGGEAGRRKVEFEDGVGTIEEVLEW